MAAHRSGQRSTEPGIIVLGNSGVGKSFICNLLIGKDEFESGYEAGVVTTLSSSYPFSRGQSEYTIWNVPGLIEANQESINRNKQEIERAFKTSPYAHVIFVWTENNGRLHHDDIIAFNALNNAYRFPEDSVLFVFNNIPSNRPSGYDEKFKFLLSKMLDSFKSAVENMFFIENIEAENKERVQEQSKVLWKLIEKSKAGHQQQQRNIMLDVDQIKKMKQELRDLERTMADETSQFELEKERTKMGYENALKKIVGERDAAQSRLAELKRTPEIKTAAPLRMDGTMANVAEVCYHYNTKVLALKKDKMQKKGKIDEDYWKEYEQLTIAHQNQLECFMREAPQTEFRQCSDSDLLRSDGHQKSRGYPIEQSTTDSEHFGTVNPASEWRPNIVDGSRKHLRYQ